MKAVGANFGSVAGLTVWLQGLAPCEGRQWFWEKFDAEFDSGFWYERAVLNMDHASEWLLAAFAAVISAILTHAFSSIRARGEWRREADMIRLEVGQHEADTVDAIAEVTTMKREYELRFITLEKDVRILDEKGKMLVTSYELEQRLQTSLIRFDELRRRIVAMEDQVFGYNLDGAFIAPQLVVRRNT